MISNFAIILFKILLTIILGGLIGYERQSKQRPAGFRTHILVCIGAMLIMILSEEMFNKYLEVYGVTLDPTRTAAQVISGVGFLGAGTIIHYGNSVRGLTTAASIWAVAAIGLSVGAGFYFLATSVTLAILFVLFIFNRISRKIDNSGNVIELHIRLINKAKIIGSINMLIGYVNGRILDMKFISENENDEYHLEESDKEITLKIIARLPWEVENHMLIKEISALDGVIKVDKI